MKIERAGSLEAMREFWERHGEQEFARPGREEAYGWLEGLLGQFRYWKLGRADKGLLRRYAMKVGGWSRAQLTRLIGRWEADGKLGVRGYRRHRFAPRYSAADVELLAEVDEAHETLSGPATRRILEREFVEFRRPEFARLAEISVAHIYNLRKRREYRQKRLHYQKTKAVAIPIGERRKPRPEGRPGYLRVDTVHQGDGPEGKGVYHLNAVDEVTQWQVVGAVESTAEAQLLPVLEDMLAQFPFRVRNFHSDNGSEYINYAVAGTLQRLLIGQTKSRPRHSNDNGLVESKNGAVVRKQIGYAYLNFHRPSAQREVEQLANGKRQIHYRKWATPWEVFAALPEPEQYLRAGQTLEELRAEAHCESDTQCARRLQKAKRKLLAKIRPIGRSA